MAGSYLMAGGRIRLNISLQNATSGKIVGIYSQTEDQDQVLPLTADAGVKLRAMLHISDLSPQRANQVSAATEANPDALKAYEKGIEKLRLDDGDGAREFLEKASRKHEAL